MDFLVDYILNFYGPTPYLIIFGILLICGLGIPIPEDITLFVAGMLCYYNLIHLGWTIGVCLLGVLIGDSVIFFLGAKFGRRLTKRWIFHKLLPDARLDAMGGKLKKTGGTKFLFFARFMPGLRAPIYFSAGTLHLPFKTFIFYDGCAALISVPSILGLVFYFGDEVSQVIGVIKKVEHGLFLVILLVILGVLGKWYWSRRNVIR